MTSLYKRATLRQQRVLRIIEGACRNAAQAHPDQQMDERFARSIAKRAAGTLTAQWRDVLALPRAASDMQTGAGTNVGLLGATLNTQGHTGTGGDTNARGIVVTGNHGTTVRKGRASKLERRSPLKRLRHEIGMMAGEARRNGEYERLEALKDVLRLIDEY